MFWESSDGYQFTPKPSVWVPSYNAEVHGDALFAYGFSFVNPTKDPTSFPFVELPGVNTVFDVDRDVDTFYIGTDVGVFVSKDSGQTWTAVEGNASIAANVSERNVRNLVAWNGKLLIATSAGPMYSTDEGKTFSTILTGISNGGSTNKVMAMYRSGDTIWATIGGFRRLHKTSLETISWTLVDSAFNSDLIYGDPQGGLYRIPGNASGIEKSIDGVNWGSIFNFTENQGAVPIKFMIANNYAYVCSRSGMNTWREDLNYVVAPGEFMFKSAYNLGDAWYWKSNIGYFWSGAYPWIWTPALGWTYILGPSEKGYFAYDLNFGWFYTWGEWFPYINVFKDGEFYTINMDSTYPNTQFTRASDNAVVSVGQVGVLNFDFTSLAGKTIKFTDSVGSHTLIINSFANDSDRGDLTMQISGQTQTFSNVQLSYTNITGPRILLQAQAILGDTTLGSSVQVNLAFDTKTAGTTQFVGYAIFSLPPITGGSNVKGTFKVE